MATQILDTELDVARKYLHFAQRALFNARFALPYAKETYNLDIMTRSADYMIEYEFKQVKYWRARYNAAMAIEQEREESI